MTTIKAVRTEAFTQYDGTNSADIMTLAAASIPAGWTDFNVPLNIVSETGGVLTIYANFAEPGEPGNYSYHFNLVMNETDWALHGVNTVGLGVITDEDMQANYIVKA